MTDNRDDGNLFWGQSKWNLEHVPPISPAKNHTVLYQLPSSTENQIHPPMPSKGDNKWDTDHVRLPSSVENLYPVEKANGTTVIETRWEIIKTALSQPISNSQDLEKAIISYNKKYDKIWKFTSLHKLFENELDEAACSEFFKITLPSIIRLALQLPDLILTGIPLLKQGENKSISMSQQQVACLLANAFLCTFPRRNRAKWESEYGSFPDINFSRLYQAPGEKVLEKLKCLCNYFRRITQKPPTGVLTFIRRSVSDNKLPNLDLAEFEFSTIPIYVSADGLIEKHGKAMLQVDFANKFIGGGVLRGGAVQEEIRFVICPELLITRLFTEYLLPNEAIIIAGCEQFNLYTGYATTFTWSGNCIDDTPFDSSGRRKTHIVAIDATRFTHPSKQFKEGLMLREIKKAYAGFLHMLETPAPPIASGNWGCGAFKGSPYLKSLLQLIVCVVTKRPLVYFTFNDIDLCNRINEMYDFLCTQHVSVGELWKYLKLFCEKNLDANQLFSFIYNQRNPSYTITHPIPQSINKKVLKKMEKRNNKKMSVTNPSSIFEISEVEDEIFNKLFV